MSKINLLKRWNNKNIIFTNNVLLKEEKEKREKEKKEKKEKLEKLQNEIYEDDIETTEEELLSFDDLIEMIEKIQTKKELIIFTKENKEDINSLDIKNKKILLNMIKEKYY